MYKWNELPMGFIPSVTWLLGWVGTQQKISLFFDVTSAGALKLTFRLISVQRKNPGIFLRINFFLFWMSNYENAY